MPKRSNPFQRLIYHIEKCVAGNSDIKVIESYMMMDSSGKEREIDVAIVSKVNEHLVVIAIECRDWKRKCNVTWIDSLIGKYESMQVNQVIAVSSSGFSKAAITKAVKTQRLSLLTLQEAMDADWIRKFYIPKMLPITVNHPPLIKEFTIKYKSGVDVKDVDINLTLEEISIIFNENPPFNLFQFLCNNVINTERFFVDATKQMDDEGKNQIPFIFKYGMIVPFFLLYKKQKYQLEFITFTGTVEREVRYFQVKSGVFNNIHYSSLDFNILNKQANITFTQQKGKGLRYSITSEDDNENNHDCDKNPDE